VQHQAREDGPQESPKFEPKAKAKPPISPPPSPGPTEKKRITVIDSSGRMNAAQLQAFAAKLPRGARNAGNTKGNTIDVSKPIVVPKPKVQAQQAQKSKPPIQPAPKPPETT
jgi:hypothetical protein